MGSEMCIRDSLFSLQSALRSGYLSHLTDDGAVTLNDKMIFPQYELLHATLGTRLPPSCVAGATIAPGVRPRRTYDINHFHCCYGHMHETLLHDTAKRSGVTLTGELQPCTGCSMGKGLRKAIPSTTTTRATEKLGRVFVDLSGKKDVASIGGSHYCMIIRDDYTRFTWLYFLKHKSCLLYTSPSPRDGLLSRMPSSA